MPHTKAMSVFSSMYGWKPNPKPSKERELHEGVRVQGGFHFQHYRAGVMIDERDGKNLITNTGIAGIAGLIVQSGSTAPFTYIAIGTSTATASSTETALVSEISTGGGERGAGTPSRVTTDITNDTAQILKTFTFTTTGTFAITEAGVFNAAASGTMLCRQVFTAITVTTNDTLDVTYKIDVD